MVWERDVMRMRSVNSLLPEMKAFFIVSVALNVLLICVGITVLSLLVRFLRSRR